jgi:long-chain acyl-CoA synthetase
MVFNLATTLTESAHVDPGKYVCRTVDRDISYAELDDLTGRFAAALRDEGVQRGDRVALQLPNAPEFLVAYYGALKAGCVVVPMNPRFTEPESAYILGHCGARKHIDDPAEVVAMYEGAKYVADTAATEPQDIAVIIYTSGTTGRAKGAELSHFQLYMSCTVAPETFGSTREDVTLMALPLFHVYGLAAGLNAVVRGASTMSLLPRFETTAVLDAMEKHRVSVALGVPTMYHALLMADVGDRDLSAFRVASCGGAPMPRALMEAFEQKFAGVKVLEGFGMSETGAAGFLNRPDARRIGSIGRPLWGVQARIAGAEGGTGPEHVGELLIKGHNVMTGYHDDPAATGEALVDGWLHTGDLGYVDDEGFYYIVDRIKDMIIRGGFNVYPREVEEVLYRHPAIREAAVVGRPDERLGEEIVAVVVLKPDAQDASAEHIVEFCRASLAGYKIPREIRFVTELPRNASGKVLKRELRRAA